MTKKLYIKTDGPIPEGCDYLTAGRVYEVLGGPEEGNPCGLVKILDDTGFDAYPLTNAASCGKQCAYLAEGATWHFCDASGNPVPAPWESTKRPKLRGEEGDLCACHASPEWNVASWKIPICEHPEYSEKDGLCLRCDHARKCHEEGFYSPQESINYRAHAEALAEALRGMVGIIDDSYGVAGYHLNGAVATWGEFSEVGTAYAALAAFDQDRGEQMSNTPERIYALERLGQFVARRERMNDTPERIYGWLNTQLSIARHYGGIKFNGHEYVIAKQEEGQPLVRADVLKREKRKGVKRG